MATCKTISASLREAIKRLWKATRMEATGMGGSRVWLLTPTIKICPDLG